MSRQIGNGSRAGHDKTGGTHNLQQKVLDEICVPHVKNSCTNGDECSKVHRPTKLPYQWQVLKNMEWKYFDNNLNKRIEEAFCDPAIEKIDKVKVGEIWRSIDFNNMEMHQSNASHKFQNIRRLSTMSSVSNQTKDLAPYCTHWVWYWKDQGIWQKYSKQSPLPGQDIKTDSNTLEKAYQSYKSSNDRTQQNFQLSSTISINFETMTQDVGNGLQNVNICRRPRRYTPLSDQASIPRQLSAANGAINVSAEPLDSADMRWKNIPTVTICRPMLYIPLSDQASTPAQPSADGASNFSAEPNDSTDVPWLEDIATGTSEVEDSNTSDKSQADRISLAADDSDTPAIASEDEAIGVNTGHKSQADRRQAVAADGYTDDHYSDIPALASEDEAILTAADCYADDGDSDPALPCDDPETVSTNENNRVELCTEHRWDFCSHCEKMHIKCAFQWQFYNDSDGQWKHFDYRQNCKLEESFSNPSSEHIIVDIGGSMEEVLFEFMDVQSDCLIAVTYCLTDVRRVSTMSTIRCKEQWLKPWCIEWLWYWRDEHGSWVPYSQENSKGMKSDVSSEELETAYYNYLQGIGSKIYPFVTNKNNYELNFETMEQKNVFYRTRRMVRRRPKFLTYNERWNVANHNHPILLPAPKGHPPDVPETWDMEAMSDDDHGEPKKVTLNMGLHTDEYSKVAEMFLETMSAEDGHLVAIHRIQNLELWHEFTQKRDRMTKKNKGRPVLEKQLWHGTNKESCEAICRQNFDFRISGSNVGTRYGQGSYFARDASYSDKYSKPDNSLCRIFLGRVLVGSYAIDKKEYKRPPPIDPKKPGGDLYDSCVNKVYHPSMYVIFDRTQAYPEYLVEYIKTTELTPA